MEFIRIVLVALVLIYVRDFIVIHELGHAFVAKVLKVPVYAVVFRGSFKKRKILGIPVFYGRELKELLDYSGEKVGGYAKNDAGISKNVLNEKQVKCIVRAGYLATMITGFIICIPCFLLTHKYYYAMQQQVIVQGVLDIVILIYYTSMFVIPAIVLLFMPLLGSLLARGFKKKSLNYEKELFRMREESKNGKSVGPSISDGHKLHDFKAFFEYRTMLLTDIEQGCIRPKRTFEEEYMFLEEKYAKKKDRRKAHAPKS